MKQYLDLLSDIMEHGIDKSDRTGTGTRSVFGRQLRFDRVKAVGREKHIVLFQFAAGFAFEGTAERAAGAGEGQLARRGGEINCLLGFFQTEQAVFAEHARIEIMRACFGKRFAGDQILLRGIECVAHPVAVA